MKSKIKKMKVGVGVMIFKDEKILMGKRKNSHGDGEYSFTGGHLEYMEGFKECAIRETLEEAGIKIKNIKFLCIKNTFLYKPEHYIHIGLIADWESGESKNLEPEKCKGWSWYDLDNLPKPIFNLANLMIDSYKTGKNYYDKE